MVRSSSEIVAQPRDKHNQNLTVKHNTGGYPSKRSSSSKANKTLKTRYPSSYFLDSSLLSSFLPFLSFLFGLGELTEPEEVFFFNFLSVSSSSDILQNLDLRFRITLVDRVGGPSNLCWHIKEFLFGQEPCLKPALESFSLLLLLRSESTRVEREEDESTSFMSEIMCWGSSESTLYKNLSFGQVLGMANERDSNSGSSRVGGIFEDRKDLDQLNEFGLRRFDKKRTTMVLGYSRNFKSTRRCRKFAQSL